MNTIIVTPYHLTVATCTIIFGAAKFRGYYRDGEVIMTMADWSFIIILSLGLYGLYHYRNRRTPMMLWLFNEDYLPEFFYVPLFFLVLSIIPTICSITFHWSEIFFDILVEKVFPPSDNPPPSREIALKFLFYLFVGVCLCVSGTLITCACIVLALLIWVSGHDEWLRRSFIRMRNALYARLEQHPVPYIITTMCSFSMFALPAIYLKSSN